MADLPISTIAIVIIFIVIAAIGLMFIFSGFTSADTSGTFFNFSQNISSNASVTAGSESQLKPLFG
jgi:hypothetical protein